MWSKCSPVWSCWPNISARPYHLLHSAQPHSDAAGRYHDSSEDTILAHALEYIRINYKSRITVTALAEFCHCSDSYLSRIFKRRTGVNINVYVNKVRMEFAKSPLCLSNESIAEIAASVGFGDPNYFSRVFTQIHWHLANQSSASGSIRIMADACF